MSKVLLYGIAAFMETSIGIWIFGQVFPKRKRMEKKHVFGEWLLFAFITACASDPCSVFSDHRLAQKTK